MTAESSRNLKETLTKAQSFFFMMKGDGFDKPLWRHLVEC